MTNLLNAEELPEWPQVAEENVSDQSQLLLQPAVIWKQTIREISEDQSLYSKTTTSRQQLRSNFRPVRLRSPCPQQNDQLPPALCSIYPQSLDLSAAVELKPFDNYIDPPPRDVTNKRIDANTKTSFINPRDLYQRYIAEEYDLPNDDARYFFRICDIISIPTQYFRGLFSHIFHGEAQAFYWSYIPKDEIFYNYNTKIKYHFDTKTNHH